MTKPTTARRPAQPLSADRLWQFDRIGALALAPDGRRAVCSVATPSMEDNRSAASLWLLPTDRAAPRRLTACGEKEGQPAWSPGGDRIAFIARRRRPGGNDDATPQLYVIGADGGEAERCSDFAPGVNAFKWLPDGQHVVFSAWVWPDAKGAAAQARRHRHFGERKESGYATSAAFYRHFDHNLPLGRVLHLLLLNLKSGRITDLFEGTAFELPRHDGGSLDFDVRPDGRRVAFVHDPAPEPLSANRLALAEVRLRSRRISAVVDDPAWDFSAPRYSADGRQLAAVAAHVGSHHLALGQLALVDADGGWRVLDGGAAAADDGDAGDVADGGLSIDGPLRWSADSDAVCFAAEQRGRRHLWLQALAGGSATVLQRGGWVQAFDIAGGVLAFAADSALHPVRVHAAPLSETSSQPAKHQAAPLRLERFNDALLADVDLGDVSEVTLTGAGGDAVQMWLVFPPGFDAGGSRKPKRHAVTHVIHGGPFAAAGDTFSYRWNAHLLAARGHVVAMVNYHGSSGFGLNFRTSIVGRQGQLELQDIEAGTDWLLQQRWADPKRVFATGGSYGGFLVAWMNGHVPAWPAGRYRAYVCHAGVFDRVATFSADSYPERPKDLAALYWRDMPKVLAQSPHAFAAQMATPTLVIHGAQDFRVPDCNGLAYYNTLKARGVDARLLWFPDENHWVLKPRNSRLWYGEFMDWLDAHGPEGRPR